MALAPEGRAATAVVMCKLFRESGTGEWKIPALGTETSSLSQADLVETMQHHIHSTTLKVRLADGIFFF